MSRSFLLLGVAFSLHCCGGVVTPMSAPFSRDPSGATASACPSPPSDAAPAASAATPAATTAPIDAPIDAPMGTPVPPGSADTFAGVPAGAPALFFTDLTSGPNSGGEGDLGAFVTLYGENFGAARGSSTVTIGGHEVARYVSWGADNALARKLDIIVVQLGANVTSGDIVVTVGGCASNARPFTVRAGDIFFVERGAANANDSNTGARDQPWRTLYRRRGQVGPGDIVYVKGGALSTADPRYPGWDCVLCLFTDNDAPGTESAPIAYVGYPGDPPVLGAPRPMRRALFVDGDIDHYVFANLRMTGYGGTVELRGDGHRIVGNHSYDGVYSNSGSFGIMGDSAHYRIYGNRIHNNGERGEKMNGSGFYLQGFGTNSDIDFGWNHIDGQNGSRAIQVYGHLDGDRVDNVTIHDNLLVGSELNNIVLGGSDGDDDILGTIVVRNNVIIGAGDPGLRVNDPNGTVIIEHNVLMGNGSPGYAGSHAQLLIERAGAGKVTFRNNIVYADAGQSYVTIEAAAGAAALIASHNLFFNAGAAPAWSAASVVANPMFVAPAALDFRLAAGSPAIDAGAASTGSDFVGIARPQQRAPDIGVHELAAP